ncbi:hypothetical protein B0A50_06320 [Salinomyces thailandicus]|uniref:Beta-glucuronidase C-terminal domain-containing protein n=1 Tax=Salinomyces thailandicus TaxID=706561 RepID=A0A4U0TT72_9PEZI|nr:hypothetical protein B0A50_06320 [Salinomyces thailandica]
MKASIALFSPAAILMATDPAFCHPSPGHRNAVKLNIPDTAIGASIAHSTSFSSFSFEPAFWVEFFGNGSSPNPLTFRLLDLITQHGGQPLIRPGGITMDSMIFDASAGDPVRTTSATGGVYRTTVGPAYYESWSNFPNGTKFVSTLNFGNDSLDIAINMAVASVMYQPDLVEYFELGNEPTNYDESRWNDSTAAYVAQWKNWTAAIDTAVNATLGASDTTDLGNERWWASSATTDVTGLHVRPADIIPAGVNSADQVAEYSIHSYPFSTCDPDRAALATIENILNHTGLAQYADVEIYPSAKAALDAGSRWVIGEFNSISCSGNPNVSDTFAQALWVVDSELIYATRNASSCHLHQGATLAFQSTDQVNTAGANGTPGFSTYDMLYPESSNLRGEARVLPSFAGQLFLAEAFATEGTRIQNLTVQDGVDQDYFAAYAFYDKDTLSKLAIINLHPYYANSTSDYTASIDLLAYAHQSHDEWQGKGWYGRHGERGGKQPYLKRLTAPYTNEKDEAKVTWAGQAFTNATANGAVRTERLGWEGVVRVRGSEAVLVFLN